MIRFTSLCGDDKFIDQKAMRRYHAIMKNYVNQIENLKQRGSKVPVQVDKTFICYKKLFM